MLEWIQSNVIPLAIVVVVITLLITVVIFYRRRSFGRGPEKAKPVDPEAVRRQNPPDDSVA